MAIRAVLLAALTLAACDEDNPARHLDGGTVDSPTTMIDAPDTPSPVTLTITYNGIPQAGVTVHYQNADSTLVATEQTDSAGVASHVIAAGGYVTAVDPYEGANGLPTSTLRTFAGVKPGDHLKLSSGYVASHIFMTVTLPVQGDTQTTRYSVNSPCSPFPKEFTSSGSGFQPSGLMPFARTCPTTDIVAVAYDANGAVTGYFSVVGQTITADGTLDYSAKSYAQPTNKTYTFTNKPGTLTSIGVEQHIGNTNGEFALVSSTATGSPDATTTMGIPTVANALGIVQTSGRALSSFHTLLDWGTLNTNAFTTDVGARKLVDISGATFDIASHSVGWTEGTGVAPDLTYVSIFGTRTTSTTTFGIDWILVGPHIAGSVVFPVLPVGAVDYNLDSDDSVDLSDLSMVKVPGGYDAIRANAFSLEDLVNSGNAFPIVTSASGSASLVTFSPLVPERKAPPTVLRHRAKR